jgi:hypothetical protein
MKPGAFEQEFEIQYNAGGGQKVFPAASMRRDRIVLNAPYPSFPEGLRCWGGLDYGKRNPSSFHVYVEYDRCVYSVFELYEPAPDINIFAAKMLACPWYDKLVYIAADGHIFNATSHQNGIACSIADHFVAAGVKKLYKGDTSQAGAFAWEAIMHEHWGVQIGDQWSVEDPTFKLFSCCPNQIREFQEAVYVSQSDGQLLTSDYKEGIADFNNHSLDDCKYYVLSRPRNRAPSKVKPINQALRW